MQIHPPSSPCRPAVIAESAAENATESATEAVPQASAAPVYPGRTGNPRLAALQSIQTAQRTPRCADPAAPSFDNLIETLVAPHFLLCNTASLTGPQCFAFVQASTRSFEQCAKSLEAMMESMPDGTLRQSIGTLKKACAVFGEPMPVARWDPHARYRQALKLTEKELPPSFVLTNDFRHWLFKNFAAIRSVLDIVRSARGLPDQAVDRMAFATTLAHTAQLKYAHALQDTTQQLSQMIEQHAAVFDDLAIDIQERILTRPSCRLATDALNLMSLPRRNMLHVCDELETLVQVTSESLQFLYQWEQDFPNFNERIEIIAMQTRAYSQRSKASAALNAHRRMLNYVRQGTADLKGGLMEEMRQTLDRIEETQQQIENFNGMKGELRQVGGQVYLALFDHVKAHSHDIEVDLRHLGARFAVADGVLLMSNRLVGDMMDQIADAMRDMRHAVDEMATIEKKRLVRTALTDEEQARFDALLVSMFPSKPVEVIDDAEPGPEPGPGPSCSSATVNRSQAACGAPADQRSLDELMAFINVEPAPTHASQHRQRRSSKKAPSGSPARATAASADLFSTVADPALQQAYAEIDESANKLPYLKKGALLSAVWRADRVRAELALDNDRPMSATRAYRLLQTAFTMLEEKSREIGEQIRIMDRTADAVADLESDPQIKRKRSAQIAAMRAQWQSQRTELDRKASMLRTEAANRQRMQTFKVFMAYPCLENFQLLQRDPDVLFSTQRICTRKALPEMTVSGFQKPQQDYLDVYRLKLQMKGVDGLPARKGTVEFHVHFRGVEADALPTAAHFKNLQQSVASGAGVHRGTVATYYLDAVIGEIAQSAR